jgi:hypothetical protein
MKNPEISLRISRRLQTILHLMKPFISINSLHFFIMQEQGNKYWKALTANIFRLSIFFQI